jgi:hypothetical protein
MENFWVLPEGKISMVLESRVAAAYFYHYVL